MYFFAGDGDDIRCVSGGICVRDRPGRKVAVSIWGKPQKRVSIDVSEDVLMSFCVAGVALCDIRRVSGGICVRGRHGRKVADGESHTNVSLSTRQKMC